MNFDRATRDERLIMYAALESYDQRLEESQQRSRSKVVQGEVLWRRHVIERLQSQLDHR